MSDELLAESAELLTEAFRDEPITAMLLDLSRPGVGRLYTRIAGARLQLHREAGAPLLAVREDHRIVGLCMLKPPHLRAPLVRLIRLWAPFLPGVLWFLPVVIRGLAASRLLKPPQGLPGRCYSLEAVAVDSAHRGRGVGRLLLEEVERICLADTECAGIYLCAGSEENRSLYEHFGYEVREKKRSGRLIAYHMVWERPV